MPVMPELEMPAAKERGIDWMSSAPLAPRTGKGSRHRAQAADGPFASAPRLAGATMPGPFAPAPRLAYSPAATSKTPKGRTPHSARRPSGGGADSGRRPSGGGAGTPGAPKTPAPQRSPGELGIAKWLEELGLDEEDGLLEALVGAAGRLTILGTLTQEEVVFAVSPVGLKGIKLRKLIAGLKERSAFRTPTTGRFTIIPSPPARQRCRHRPYHHHAAHPHVCRARQAMHREAHVFAHKRSSPSAAERPLGWGAAITRNEVMPPPPFPQLGQAHANAPLQVTSLRNRRECRASRL